jgi:tRNA dimethylallyltransferase
MDIGTAKPTLAERSRVPHHLIDVCDPDEVWSLAVYQKAACQAIEEIYTRGRLPIMVGGTGQYIRAVTEAWQIPRAEPNPGLRIALEMWAIEIGQQGLHDRLRVLDPEAARTIDARNLRRVIRALEVILTTGKRFSSQRKQQSSQYSIIQLGINRPRPELYARIDNRIHAMLEAGFIDEVRGLLERGYASDLPTLSAIGYREVIEYIRGAISLDEAVAQIKRQTRIFVRRQANWFKLDDPMIHWFEVSPDTVDKLENAIRAWLDRL